MVTGRGNEVESLVQVAYGDLSNPDLRDRELRALAEAGERFSNATRTLVVERWPVGLGKPRGWRWCCFLGLLLGESKVGTGSSNELGNFSLSPQSPSSCLSAAALREAPPAHTGTGFIRADLYFLRHPTCVVEDPEAALLGSAQLARDLKGCFEPAQ